MFLNMGIRFPYFNIEFNNIKKSINILGFKISFYGILMVVAILTAYFITVKRAEKTEQEKETYLDLTLIVLVASFVGARLLYVIFSWKEYKNDYKQIFKLSSGGMSLYGGLIAGIIACFVFCKIKKKSFGLLLDTSILGLVLGQAIARWGDFFNRESFGKYTDSFLAMQIRRIDAPAIAISKDSRYLENSIKKDGFEYIQVHPTFLYEFLVCILIFVVIILFEKVFIKNFLSKNNKKYKKFDGEIMLIYLFMYGCARFFIEQLRTDKLLIANTNISISSVLSVLSVAIAITIFMYKRIIKPKIIDKYCKKDELEHNEELD